MLKISDFPKDQFNGYFELFEAYHNTKAEIDKLTSVAKELNSAGLTRLLGLRKELEKYKPGDWVARVYAKSAPVEGVGLAKEHSNVLFAEIICPESELEGFVKMNMAKLKKVV